jgi:hypothetical protein
MPSAILVGPSCKVKGISSEQTVVAVQAAEKPGYFLSQAFEATFF